LGTDKEDDQELNKLMPVMDKGRIPYFGEGNSPLQRIYVISVIETSVFYEPQSNIRQVNSE